ncbi:MAG TPA: DUF4031 domain-containing protein [Actinomycetaceae bacterium]|nr:DUF4031 domain-containing protein [Actinomycetaceae bacterium]
MALLIDPPRWPAHGTIWSHLVSDHALMELHEFAQRAGIPYRGFDHDHYDVPAERYRDVVELGAEPVSATDLVRRLLDSGLRVTRKDRTLSRAAALGEAHARWAGLLPGHPELGQELLARWREPHRHYHDIRHLAHCLTALDDLSGGQLDRPVALAAWFHDVVYRGTATDEAASAALAEDWLPDVVGRVEAAEVARLVRLTASHDPAPEDERGRLLSDSDLSILGVSEGRYHVYLRDVRLDFAHVPDDAFFPGRRHVVEALLAKAPLFRTHRGFDRWEEAARGNLLRELAALDRIR